MRLPALSGSNLAPVPTAYPRYSQGFCDREVSHVLSRLIAPLMKLAENRRCKSQVGKVCSHGEIQSLSGIAING